MPPMECGMCSSQRKENKPCNAKNPWAIEVGPHEVLYIWSGLDSGPRRQRLAYIEPGSGDEPRRKNMKETIFCCLGVCLPNRFVVLHFQVSTNCCCAVFSWPWSGQELTDEVVLRAGLMPVVLVSALSWQGFTTTKPLSDLSGGFCPWCADKIAVHDEGRIYTLE